MACKIEILEVVGNLPLLSVTVRGTAEDCNRVRVCLQCAAGAPPLIETAAVDGGEWSVSFPGAVEHGCDCGKPFHVRAECADDTAEPPCQGTCFAELEGELRCCKIEILNVVGSLPGPSVTVKGTAAECDVVRVCLQCFAATFVPPPFIETTPVVGGAWSVTFTDTASGQCGCGESFVVRAECADDPSAPPCNAPCFAEVKGDLECPGEEECPSISWSSITIGSCDPETDTTPIAVEATLSSAGFYAAELHDSLGVMLNSVSGTGITPLSGTGNYGGPVTFSVVVTTPADCPGEELTVSPEECIGCPDVDLDYEIGEACDEEGKRTVTVTAQLDSGDPYNAELRDAADTVLATGSGPGPQTLSHTDSYPGGTSQTFKVVVTSPAICGDTELTIDVPQCEGCPDVSISHDFGDCEDGNRSVTVTAELDSGDPYDAELRDAADTVLATGSGPGPQTLSHASTFAIESSQSFKVVITSPPGCGEVTDSFVVDDCTAPPHQAVEACSVSFLEFCGPPSSLGLFLGSRAARFQAVRQSLLP